jgi:hypothetical protein
MPYAIEPSTEIAYRHDFALLANARGVIDAVEVGTDLGVFAREFLSRFTGNWLFCIDPYVSCKEFPYDRIGDIITASVALAPYHGRCRIIHAESPEIAVWVKTVISPSFVYIDASHEESDVLADLMGWWEVLSDGGILAGHDYDPAHPGVINAVQAFAKDRQLIVRLTRETASPASWYCYKGEPERLIHKFFWEGDSENPRAPVRG